LATATDDIEQLVALADDLTRAILALWHER
jgi:hypothetical protein